MNKPLTEKLIEFLSKYILKPAYIVYEKWLWLQIKNGPIPEHVAIIPDGNRRWAKRLGLNPLLGHYFGYDRVREVLRWCLELGVKVITIYALSLENLYRRSKEELANLFTIFEKALKEILSSEDIRKFRVRVRVIGKRELLTPTLQALAKEVEETTMKYNDRFLNIAIGYSGRQEIIDAVKKLIMDVKAGKIKVEEIDEKIFSKYLYTGELPKPDPDLIIRTSGEERLSGFLLWQSAYSELYFCDVFWPEFRKIDFWRAVRSYQKRERRFGR